jgi:arabinoxylan arabinofuranohydrolase
MRKTFLFATAFMALSMQAGAQTSPAADYKGTSNGNPISASVFCADPTAIDYEGRLYVYGTNDHQQYIKNNKTGSNGYGNIKSLVVFSTDDMVNWTFHGTIDVGKVCTWAGQSWAPSAVWREKMSADSTTTTKEFYVYFANGGGSVGVMKSTKSPLGPFTSPKSQAMIRHGMAGVDPCNWLFDPGVVIDENGVGWIAFGGGDPQSSGSNLWPGNSRIAKLKSSMTDLDGAAVNMPAPYLFEASELNIMDGKFVYTYNTSWSDRNDWNSFEKRNGQPAPSSCSMCYMVSDNPLDPNSWEYRGEYVPNEGNFGMGWGNNHTHLHKFNGNYYLFYHSTLLESAMKNGGAMKSDASGYRSIGVNKATVNESTQKINKMTLTKTGVTAIKNMDPYQLQQAETMASSGGISYEDYKNIKTVPSKNSLGNDASENLYIKMAPGSWTSVRKVDFGTDGAKSFTLRTKGTGKLEIRFSRAAKAQATVEFSSTTFEDHTIEIDPSLFKGVKSNVFFVFTEGTNVQFDSWQFSNEVPTAIKDIHTPSSSVTKGKNGTYDLNGRRVQKGNAQRGIVIENGKKVTK